MRWALNGGPELIVGFREGFRVCNGKGEHGVVDFGGGGTGRKEEARWGGVWIGVLVEEEIHFWRECETLKHQKEQGSTKFGSNFKKRKRNYDDYLYLWILMKIFFEKQRERARQPE
jgi:hypothetical protein